MTDKLLGEAGDSAIKFAYWVPNGSGGLISSKVEQRTGWDIGYNIELARIAERAGFDYALSRCRFTACDGAESQHEPMILSQALLAATERLKVVAALLPGPWSPAVAAKQVATLSRLHGGRIAVNIVSSWSRGEFAAIGEPWLDHDERYRRSEEFVRALRGIWSEDAFDFSGDFYRFHHYCAEPKPLGPLPEIFQAGSSCAARDMAARVSDWYVANGATAQELRAQVDDLRAKAGRCGRHVEVGVNAFAIARETAAEAKAVLADIIDKADPNAGQAVRYDDGFCSNLIGTPCQVAERIMDLKDAGADLIFLGFLRFQEEVEHFGRTVIPIVRELERQRRAAGAPKRFDRASPCARPSAEEKARSRWARADARVACADRPFELDGFEVI